VTDPQRVTLVVGATGQLGHAVVAELLAAGRPVRALVRSPERADELRRAGAELVVGDLRDAPSIDRAVDGVAAVVATANSTAPRRGDTLATDSTAMTGLVAAAEQAGVSRFVYPSTAASALDADVPVIRRQAFITVADAAAVLVAALDAPSLDRQVVEVGGPEILDWNDVARVFGRVLDRPVRVRTTPEKVFAVAQRALRPLAPSAANIMGLDRFAATVDAPFPPKVAYDLGVDRLTTVEEFLTAKAALPAD